jgi:hypothetical protein
VAATVQEIAQGVADRWGIEQVFHDVKENERIGQVQLRKVWSNVGAFNLGLWVNSLVELWAWKRGRGSLVDRRESPWDDAARRASHGDRRKALQQELLDTEFQRCGICGHGSRKIRKLFLTFRRWRRRFPSIFYVWLTRGARARSLASGHTG